MNTKAVVVVVTGLVLAVGCSGPTTNIGSVRAPGISEKLTDLFVISHVGKNGETPTASFEEALVQTGARCGIRLGISHVSRLELDTKIHAERLKQFGSRHLLILTLTGGVIRSGTITRADYDAELFERTSEKMIWRAYVQLSPGESPFGDAGKTLARDLLRKLREDGLISPCAELADPAVPPQPAIHGAP